MIFLLLELYVPKGNFHSFVFPGKMDVVDIQLTEDDIPGSSLGDREPCYLTNKELVFWLRCRGLQSSKLKTKAALVAKYVI